MYKGLFKRLFPLTMIADDGGGGGTGWTESLPEAVRTWDEVTNSDSPEKFWGQITDMRSHLGQSLRVPGQDAGEPAWKEFNQKLIAKVPHLMPKPDASDADRMKEVYAAMGKPEEAGKYAVPEGLERVNGDLLTNLQTQAHALHLNNEQFGAMAKDLDGRLKERDTVSDEKVTADQAALKTEWGAAFDANYAAITKYLEDTKAPPELRDDASSKKLSLDVAKWVHSQFSATKGEGDGAANDGSTGDVVTPAEAQMQMNEIRANKEHAFWNRSDPGHALAMERMVKLQKLMKGAV